MCAVARGGGGEEGSAARRTARPGRDAPRRDAGRERARTDPRRLDLDFWFASFLLSSAEGVLPSSLTTSVPVAAWIDSSVCSLPLPAAAGCCSAGASAAGTSSPLLLPLHDPIVMKLLPTPARRPGPRGPDADPGERPGQTACACACSGRSRSSSRPSAPGGLARSLAQVRVRLPPPPGSVVARSTSGSRDDRREGLRSARPGWKQWKLSESRTLGRDGASFRGL